MKINSTNNLNKEIENLFQLRIALENFKERNYSINDFDALNIIDQAKAKLTDVINSLSPRFYVKPETSKVALKDCFGRKIIK